MPCDQVGDPEDQGYGAINNQSEPFQRRFDTDTGATHLVFSSADHGDPAGPIFRAESDDPVVCRVNQTGSLSRGLSVHLADHQWRRFEHVAQSPQIGDDDVFTPGKSKDLVPLGGAGGKLGSTGDYTFEEVKTRGRLESGMWGMIRVGEETALFPLRNV